MWNLDSDTQNIIVVCVVLIVVIIILLLLWPSDGKKSNDSSQEKEITSLPSPTVDVDSLCILSNRQYIKCGANTKSEQILEEHLKLYQKDPKLIPELKLYNKSPLKLDIYHRTDGSKDFIFVASIPSMKFAYAYENEKGGKFHVDDNLFATQHGETKIIYLSVPLVAGNPNIVWGESTSDIDEGITDINLIGEIGHIKVRNYSLVPYKISYYGEVLGIVEPYDKKNDLYTELRLDRLQGFRLTSKLTFDMLDVEGPIQSQSIELTQRTMTVLNVGLVLMS